VVRNCSTQELNSSSPKEFVLDEARYLSSISWFISYHFELRW